MLKTIQTFGEHLPASCSNSCPEAWAVFDSFLSKYGTDHPSAERTTRVLRHGITLFGDAALPVAPSVLNRMTVAFETTGFPCYLWIAGKIVSCFGNETEPNLRVAFLTAYERSTHKVIALLQEKSPGHIPDGMILNSS
jgi:transportin-3